MGIAPPPGDIVLLRGRGSAPDGSSGSLGSQAVSEDQRGRSGAGQSGAVSDGAPGPLRMQGGDIRILIVEDDVWLLETLETALKRLGCDAVGTRSGEEAERLLLARTFDVLLCDLILPGRDGIDVIRAVRGAMPSLPIIAMTGASGGHGEELLRDACSAGANDTIRKPFRLADLLRKSRDLIAEGGGSSS